MNTFIFFCKIFLISCCLIWLMVLKVPQITIKFEREILYCTRKYWLWHKRKSLFNSKQRKYISDYTLEIIWLYLKYFLDMINFSQEFQKSEGDSSKLFGIWFQITLHQERRRSSMWNLRHISMLIKGSLLIQGESLTCTYTYFNRRFLRSNEKFLRLQFISIRPKKRNSRFMFS